MRICVVGLGNIGLNLLALLSEKFPSEVIGVDIDERVVGNLQLQGYQVTADYRELPEVDNWLLTLSTGEQGENIFAALEQMVIHKEALISIESTLPLGTMKRVREYLEQRGFTLGLNLYLIHVPHRVMFGVDKTVCDTPRVMGAFTEACLARGRQFYVGLVPQIVEASDVRVAELSKVVENVKRYVDVAFAEEIYRYCVRQNISFHSLREAVNSKSNVELLGTDWGIGGECLPKDMRFLQSKFSSEMLAGARKADTCYRAEISKQVGSGQKVLVKGLTFKPGVKELKFSCGVELIKQLEENDNQVWVEDPLFSAEELTELGFRPFSGQTYDVCLERQGALNPRLGKNSE